MATGLVPTQPCDIPQPRLHVDKADVVVSRRENLLNAGNSGGLSGIRRAAPHYRAERCAVGVAKPPRLTWRNTFLPDRSLTSHPHQSSAQSKAECEKKLTP